jgi:Zn-dependent peptidase ImmA (M78 family)
MAVVRRNPSDHNGPRQTPSVGDLRALQAELVSAGVGAVPIDVNAAARYLGLHVAEEIMDDDLSGYLEHRNGTWFVGVNALHHRNRRRFTVAHEIAHYVLHRRQSSSFHDNTFARRANSHDRMEQEADRFAAELLMPETAVRQAIANGTTSVSALADAFGVSALAMKFRLKNLGFEVA